MVRRSSGGRRRHVILSDPQDEALIKFAARTGLTVSEHMRRAVDFYILKYINPVVDRNRR